MTLRIAAALLLAALTYANAQSTLKDTQGADTSQSSCELAEDDYAVYAAVLDAILHSQKPGEDLHGKGVLILNMTAGAGFVRARSSWGRSQETAVDFSAKKGDRCPLKVGFGDSESYRVIPTSEIDDLFKVPGGWKAFHQKYPNVAGFLQFSRPGFDSAHDEAFVWVVRQCGGLCGEGNLYLLGKENGRWDIRTRWRMLEF